MITNLTGKRFGSLTAVLRLDERTSDGKVQYLCKCDCGNTKVATATNLNTGRAKSCGCQSWKKKYKPFSFKDDMRIYSVWYDIKRRCEDDRRDDYERYGGRGIAVCEEWHDFQNFLDWVKDNGYRKGLTIDRIDNNKGYSPNNCRLVDQKGQANNKRNNHLITLKGVTKTMAEWARELEIPYTTIRARQRRGWSDEDSLLKPIRGGDENDPQ